MLSPQKPFEIMEYVHNGCVKEGKQGVVGYFNIFQKGPTWHKLVEYPPELHKNEKNRECFQKEGPKTNIS